jgi:oxygen-independent coproporphyrinogen-3 oxidase
MPKLFRAQRQIEEELLPSPEDKLGLLRLAIDKLTAAGYRYIGMDHFALPEDELSRAQQAGGLHRNFMGYTTHAESDLIGFGVSAISHVGDSFSQNPRELPAWEAAIDAGRPPVWRGLRLSEDDVIRAELIQQLMCQGELDIAAFEERFGIDFHDYFAPELLRVQALQADGLVTVAPTHLAATDRGRLLLRIIAACFDRYLHQDAAEPARFSRSI